MSESRLTILGLEDYMNNLRPTSRSLFEQLQLPAGIDKQLLVDNILIKSASYEMLYPDPDFMMGAVGVWGRKWYRTFEKWIAALNFQYDPLYNYDRTEEWTITDDGKRDLTNKSNEKLTNNLTDLDTRNLTETVTPQGNVTTTNKVSAFNASTFQNDSESVVDDDKVITTTDTGTDTINHTGTAVTDTTGTVGETNTNTNIRKGRAYGNIGVTTSQQMLESELDIAEWNLYEHITDLFLNEFVIPVF